MPILDRLIFVGQLRPRRDYINLIMILLYLMTGKKTLEVITVKRRFSSSDHVYATSRFAKMLHESTIMTTKYATSMEMEKPSVIPLIIGPF